MLETKDRGFHWLIIVGAILLGTQLLPPSVHAESLLPTAEETRNDETGEVLNENSDEADTRDGRDLPSVLVRYIHSIDGSSPMGILMTEDMQKATERIEGGIRNALILSSGCQMISNEDYGSSEFGYWLVDPAGFNFVVTNTIEGYTKAKDLFEFNQPLQFTETWEVKKGLDATISKKWRTSFEFHVDAGLTFEQEDFRDDVQALITTVVTPRRGPILKEICGFIQEHST